MRWIKAADVESAHTARMDQIKKTALSFVPQANTDRKLAAVAGQRKLATVAAAWPNGVSPLAQAVDACQRRDPREAEWLARTPNSIALPPLF